MNRDEAYALRRQLKAAAPRRQKCANQRVEIDGHAFDSKAEARYFGQLQIRLKAGEIQNLRRQVPFELAPAVVIWGRKRPPLRYVADFVWEEGGKTVRAAHCWPCSPTRCRPRLQRGFGACARPRPRATKQRPAGGHDRPTRSRRRCQTFGTPTL